MMYGKSFLAVMALAAVLAAGGSALADEQAPPKELLALKELSSSSSEYRSELFDGLRPNAIKEAAQTLAIQAGVKWRYDQINASLDDAAGRLDKIFNFNHLLLNEGKVLPPVIGEARNGFALESDTVAKSTEVAYRILAPARLVTLPPSWRDYLYQSFSAVEDVNPAVLPKNSAERKIWDEAIEKGWVMGIDQANRVYASNLNRLVRDFKGMLRFKVLAAQDIVSVPVLAEGRLGVQIGDQIMDVDQRIFRITAPTTFRRVEEWNPVFATQR